VCVLFRTSSMLGMHPSGHVIMTFDFLLKTEEHRKYQHELPIQFFFPNEFSDSRHALMELEKFPCIRVYKFVFIDAKFSTLIGRA
jgi:hypothetical protein